MLFKWGDIEMKLEEQVFGIEPQATEETLQSIEQTLKRIETILFLACKNLRVLPDVQAPLEQKSKESLVD